MTIRIIELALLLALSLISDLRTGRIDNRLNAVFISAGALTGLAFNCLDGLASSAAGILVPFILLFWLFLLRMLGAGDIKLFCAIGSIMGAWFAAWCMAWSFLAGGIMALALMILRKNAGQRFRYLGGYLKACLFTGSLLEYSEITDKSSGSKFHFSPAIAVGAVIQVVLALLKP